MEGKAAYYFDQDLYFAIGTDPLELAARNVALILNDSRSFLVSFVTASHLEFNVCEF